MHKENRNYVPDGEIQLFKKINTQFLSRYIYLIIRIDKNFYEYISSIKFYSILTFSIFLSQSYDFFWKFRNEILKFASLHF